MHDRRRVVRPAPLNPDSGRKPQQQPPDTPVVRLSGCGQVYVTLAAAERYAEHARQMIEGARKELTALLLDAKLVRDGEPQTWRARSRSTGLDLSATVIREGRLLVVVAVNVRTSDR